MKALDQMCRGRKCTESEVEPCIYREQIFKWVLDLASKGFTVTEVQCHFGSPLNHIDMSLWEDVCTHCIEQISVHDKQTCKHRKGAEKILHLLITQGFVVKSFFCQFNPFKTDEDVFPE